MVISHKGLAMSSTDTKTRGLTINAAFLKDIKDDNRDLKNLLDKILPLAQHPQTAANHWPELIGLFSDLCDQLALHFSLEEAYGYFEDAVGSAPQLSSSAEETMLSQVDCANSSVTMAPRHRFWGVGNRIGTLALRCLSSSVGTD